MKFENEFEWMEIAMRGWRLQMRAAQEACRQGRLEEAGRLIEEGQLQQYRPGQKLTTEVARNFAERAKQQTFSGDVAAAWRDMETARSLGGETQDWLSVRQELIRFATREAENYLEAGEPLQALTRLEKLEQYQAASESLQRLKEVSRRLILL